MRKPAFTSLAALLLLILCSVPWTHAQEVLVWGPQKYLRTTGTSNEYQDTFPAVSGDAVIRLWNGDNSGEKRVEDGVSTASVHLNGRLIFGPQDFNQNTYAMEAVVPVSAENTLAVVLGSAPQSYVTISVAQENPLPQTTLSSVPGAIETGGSAALSWTSFQAEHITIQPDIGAVVPSGTVTVSPGHTTTYTLTATGPHGTVSTQTTLEVLGATEPPAAGTFGEAYAELIPDDAVIDAYDAERFSIVTGTVQDEWEAPLPGVMVRVFGHPEYGSVHTDMHGVFSIPVEGGKTHTIEFKKQGSLTAHRKVYVSWNDISRVEIVRLTLEDPVSTRITFDGNAESALVHRSTEVRDGFGNRSCSLVFSGDNQAFLVDENGTDLHELTTLHVRATEYRSPESMPAELPPTSAFTYCVELSVDGVDNVRFSKAVTIWVHNFLGFDVGETIPVGFYNRNAGRWEPSKNGVVVRLLDIDADGIIDGVDATGNREPDDLNGNGSFADEVKGIQENPDYHPEATFWRAETTHFTPCDLNLPQGAPPDAIRPNAAATATADAQSEATHTCRRYNASFVEDRSRIFHEDIAIPGIDMTLHYASNRVPGYQTLISVPVSGDTIPPSLKRMIVTVDIAGRRTSEVLAPAPNQVTEFFWDGVDYRGRPVQTPITAHLTTGFVYDALYYTAGDFEAAFAQPGLFATDVPSREEVVLWKRQDILVSPPQSKGATHLADGWSLSSHHHMNLQDCSSLHKGDGTLVQTNVRVIDTTYLLGKTYLHYPDSVAVDASGDLYVGESFRGVVYKIDTQGNRTPFAGAFNWWGYSGDGGPAVDAQLQRPNGLAVDNSGNVFITDLFRIRKIDPNGIITTIAGGDVQGYTGDGGPAVEALLYSPKGITVDKDGNIYFAENDAHRIRKIDPYGVITTIAGVGASGLSGDGGPALEARLSNPYDVAVDARGNLYIADANNNRIRMIDISGIITTVAGTGATGLWGGGFSGDGGRAVDAQLRVPKHLDVDSQGNLYISDSGNLRLRLVNSSGIITTLAGSGGYGWDGGIHPAIQAKFKDCAGLCVDAAGNLYVADRDNSSIRKISHPSAFKRLIMDGSNVFAEGNGQAHIISIEGKHLATVDIESGVTLYSYLYDVSQNLIAVVDQFGNRTDIERDENGNPMAIISPDGLTTELTIDMNHHLERITLPDGGCFDFDYTPKGLMTVKTEPNGNRFNHDFDADGRLVRATDQEGGSWGYTRSVDGRGDVFTHIITAEGNLFSYHDRLKSSGEYVSVISDPSGAETHFRQSPDGLYSQKTLPCGMDLSLTYDLNEEYHYRIIKELKEVMPSGLERITTRNQSRQDTDNDQVPDIFTETLTTNGQSAVLENRVLSAQKTAVSPEGRVVTTNYDPDTLQLTDVSIPGFYDIHYEYDAKGRMTAVRNHSREVFYDYDDVGFLASVTRGSDPPTTFSYDPVGRPLFVDRPDSSSIGFAYDRNGNMYVLSNPFAVDHHFVYDAVNSMSEYQAPLSGSTRYTYDLERRLVRSSFPSGKEIRRIYDTTQLVQVQTPDGNIDATYACAGKLDTLSLGSETIQYGYDGNLVTSEWLGGTLEQELRYAYDHDFRITEFSYAGDTQSYFFDNDGLVVHAGRFAIQRNADNGQPEMVTDGTVGTVRTFNGYGEVDQEEAVLNGSTLVSWHLVRDAAGRIVQKTETTAGLDSVSHYTYDIMGRLLTVELEGLLTEAYQYNPDGTRARETNAVRGIFNRSFEYSDEGHLLAAGDVAFQYDLDGFLTRKVKGTDETTFRYSLRGELLKVVLPDGTLIEYVHDPLGRRIAKKVNGVVMEKYLWHDITQLLAVYDGSDNLVVRFEYADDRTPPVMLKDGLVYYLFYDPVGSLKVVADVFGRVVKAIDYDAFGNIVGDTDPSFGVPFGFAGGLMDSDTGLVRFGYRDYDPDIGRWTAKDPLLFNGGDTDLYGYCLNDPVNLVDPSGLINWSAVGRGAMGVIGGGVGVATGALISTTGLGAVGGLTAVIGGSAYFGWGVSQLITGLLDNKLPFMGLKESIIRNTTSPGLLQDELLGLNTLTNMLLTGRTAPTRIGKINTAIQKGHSIYSSFSTIKDSIDEANKAPSPCGE